MKKLLLITALCVLGLFNLNAQEPETVTVGSVSGNSYRLPVHTGQAFSVSQQIYKAAEINKTGKISKIAFKVNAPGSTVNREWNIYLQNTTRGTIDNNNSWFSVDNDDVFFNGTVSISSELVEITLDRKFEYTGDNLMLCVYDKTGSIGSKNVDFHNYTTTNTAISYFGINDHDPANMNGNGSTRAFNNCIILTFAGADEEEIKPEAPTNLTAEALSDTEIRLSWTASEKATSYKVYKKDNETAIASGISDTTYVVKDLTPGTNYCFTVTAVADQESEEHSNEACAKTLSKLTTFAFDFEEGSFYNNTLEGLRVYQGNEANPSSNWGTVEDRIATGNAAMQKYFAGKDGSRAVYSMSIEPNANPIPENYYTPDNYIVTTKSYLITEKSTLEWDIRQAVDGKEDNYSIIVSEDGVNFRELWYERYSNSTGATKAYSLAGEAGKELYIGFRHHEITYGGALCLDNVKLVTESTVTPEDEIDPTAPRIPTKVEAIGWSETTLKVKWNAAQNAESYNIYSEDTLVVKGVTATEYMVENLKPETNYCFQVTAVKDTVESAKSSEACDFTLDAKPVELAAPTNLKASYSSEFDIRLTWDKVENATVYDVYQDDVILLSVAETTHLVTNIEDKNTTYCFKVKAVYGNDSNKVESPFSDEICTSIAELENPTEPEQPEDPETPTDSLTLAAPVVTATATNDSTIVLTWNAVEGAATYNVYQGTDTVAIATAVKDTTYTVSGLKAETEYSFTVTAVNENGESAKSAVVKATTLKGVDGIEELNAAISIYPNPVKDELFIATEVNVKEVAIYDIYGRQAMRQQVNETTSQQVVNVADLNSGIYFVKVVTNNGEIVKRFVKE